MNPPTVNSPSPVTPAKSSVIKAGWICLILGYLTFWIFGFGFVFFGVTKILAVIGMCTNQVKQGVILFVSSFLSLLLCGILFFALILGTAGVAAKHATDQMRTEQIRQFTH